MNGRYAIWLALAPLLGGCQTVHSAPATVNLSAADTRAAVISVLAKSVRRAHIELGPAEANTSVITVLPPPLGPLEMNSPVLPIHFDIERHNGRCRAVRQDTKEAFDLPGVSCLTPGS